MSNADFRLKVRHFFKKNKKIVLIILSIWAIIVYVNYMLKNRVPSEKPETTYEPHVSVMSETSSTPTVLQKPIENLIKEYIESCNRKDYEKAYYMLSEECREYAFDNSPSRFIEHVTKKMPNEKKYSIQNYSNFTADSKKIYLYEVKYTEDLLATGLTGTDYLYTSEKIAFYEDEEDNIKMSVGGYIYQTPVQSIAENEYLKIDILEKVVNYATEEYKVKFTNRSQYTVVVSDGYEGFEITLQLGQEERKSMSSKNVVLKPGESLSKNLVFEKFVDDGDSSLLLNFNSIRVMEKYSGILDVSEEVIEQELNNAIAKFSMSTSVAER